MTLKCCLGIIGCLCALASCTQSTAKKTSGNPVFPGWYADPEGIVFGKQYWIYPTLSLLYGEDQKRYQKDLERKQMLLILIIISRLILMLFLQKI